MFKLLFKRVILIMVAAGLIVGMGTVALANQPVNVFVNSTQVVSDQTAYLEETTNVTYVPLRAVSEALKLTVSWDNLNQVITLEKDGQAVKLKAGSDVVILNGEEKVLDGPVELLETTNRSMVPVRFFADVLPYQVKASASAGIGIFDENAGGQ